MRPPNTLPSRHRSPARAKALLAAGLAILVTAPAVAAWLPEPLRPPPTEPPAPPAAPSPGAVLAGYFEEHLSPAGARYVSHTPDATLTLAPREAVLGLPQLGEPPAVVRMEFLGASADAAPRGEEALPGVSSYLLGPDPAGWVHGLRHFARVRYVDAWPGIDVVFYFNAGGAPEYDFVLRPGAQAEQIQLRFDGADSVGLERGDLVLATPAGPVRHAAPVAYAEEHGGAPVQAAFRLLGGDRVSLDVAPYDPRATLVIDPVVLVMSRPLGGGSGERGRGIAVDAAGDLYVTGTTFSSDFPMVPGPSLTPRAGPTDAFVAKLDAAGTLLYATFLGGSGSDAGHDIAVDAAGQAYVVGETDSPDFPSPWVAYGGGAGDAFLTVLDASGTSIVDSRYFGGSGWDFADGVAVGMAVTGMPLVYVAGTTTSPSLPTGWFAPFQAGFGGYYDAFVAAFNGRQLTSLVYATSFGGAGYEWGYDVRGDGMSHAYLATRTDSAGFPPALPGTHLLGAAPAGHDALVVKFDVLSPGLASYVYGTRVGGADIDIAKALAVDTSGQVYLAGETVSADYPTTAGGYDTLHAANADVFVTKLDPAGAAMVYSTYVGGLDSDVPSAIDVDAAGNAYVAGYTQGLVLPLPAAGYPTTPLSFPPGGGAWDAFVTKVNPAGSALTWSTLLGGLEVDLAWGLALGPGPGQAAVVGETHSPDFPGPLYLGASAPVAGPSDAFVAIVDCAGLLC